LPSPSVRKELKEITITLGQKRIKRKLQSPSVRKGTKENCHHPRSGKELKEITITLGQKRIKRKLQSPSVRKVTEVNAITLSEKELQKTEENWNSPRSGN